jgi:hypothetical protein
MMKTALSFTSSSLLCCFVVGTCPFGLSPFSYVHTAHVTVLCTGCMSVCLSVSLHNKSVCVFTLDGYCCHSLNTQMGLFVCIFV